MEERRQHKRLVSTMYFIVPAVCPGLLITSTGSKKTAKRQHRRQISTIATTPKRSRKEAASVNTDGGDNKDISIQQQDSTQEQAKKKALD
ncbi:hypothetical protein ACLKA6_000676 [Drosophila palustris]